MVLGVTAPVCRFRLRTEAAGSKVGSPSNARLAPCVLGIALLAGRIAFRNKLVARGCGLLLVVVGYVVDRRAGWAVKFHALGVEHVFLRPI